VVKALQIAYTVGAANSGTMSEPRQIPTEAEYKAAMEEMDRDWDILTDMRLSELAEVIVTYEKAYFTDLG
jgi:antitoxin component HigA of HigAB toxin-antitoxin module